ncbi:hypothetical protein EV421DRAFT_2024038 [Armillaria borealis]|uniref:Uncharacterized protein n=1 Tax=Armillaria borealis TaxID=47425 RepID=A0AA39MFY5_9AGAR|nr:hypothetical protein EV421DRAFT_2024038 [Armillaria borealis]
MISRKTMIAQRRGDTYPVFRDMKEIYNSYKHNQYRISLLQSFFPHSQRSPGRGARTWFKGRDFDEGCKCISKQLPFDGNVVDWNSALVAAWVSLGLLLFVAGFKCGRRRCRKITDIESKAVHADVKPPVEDWKNAKTRSQIMTGVVDDLPLA